MRLLTSFVASLKEGIRLRDTRPWLILAAARPSESSVLPLFSSYHRSVHDVPLFIVKHCSILLIAELRALVRFLFPFSFVCPLAFAASAVFVEPAALLMSFRAAPALLLGPSYAIFSNAARASNKDRGSYLRPKCIYSVLFCLWAVS